MVSAAKDSLKLLHYNNKLLIRFYTTILMSPCRMIQDMDYHEIQMKSELRS